MPEHREDSMVPFRTVAMAKILLDQDLVSEAVEVIRELELSHPDDPRIAALRIRMSARLHSGDQGEQALEPIGEDRVGLTANAAGLVVEWELTPEGLALARRKVRFSGKVIVRLFTASLGPRGVRTATRDFPVENPCARMEVGGTPRDAVFVAAVGFLGNNGAFVPLARALPCASRS